MGERFEQDGVVYEDLGNGQVRVVGYADAAPAQPQRIGTPRGPTPSEQIAADQAPLREALLQAQIAKAEADAAKAQSGTAGAERGEATTQMRSANLDALVGQINEVQRLFDTGPGATSGVSGIIDYLPTDANRAFDAAGAGLTEQALASFRVPGIGAQSDADAARLERAYGISSSNRDSVNAQQLDQLRARVDQTRAALGLPPAQWQTGGQQRDQQLPAANMGGPGGPTVLPTAAGAVGGREAVNAQGVTDQADGGFRVEQSIYGLGNEVASLVQQGADENQVMAHIAERFGGAGIGLNPGIHRDFVSQVVAAHRANPNTPVKQLGTGWDQFHMVPNADTGGSIIGGLADSNLGAAAISAANAVSGGNLGNIAGDNAQSAINYGRGERPISSLTGDVVGSALMMSGVNRLGGMAANSARPLVAAGGRFLTAGGGIGGDMAYGATRGFSETEGGIGERLAGAGLGAVSAGGGNAIGSGITSGTGRLVRGVSDPAVQMLTARNIPLTMGQTLGNRGMFGRAMNRMESVPILGDMMGARRADGVEAFNREVFRDALEPIGGQVQGTVGQEAIGQAQQQVSDAYSILDGRTFNPDSQLVNDLGPALQAGRSIPRVGEEFGAVMDRRIGPLFGQQGQISGREFQDGMQTLRGARSSFNRDGAMGEMAADEVARVEEALTGLVNRQAPDVMPQLNNANRAFANLQPVEAATMTAAGNGGVFTPAQLGRATINNTKRFGGSHAAARGQMPFNDLQRAAQEVLPSTVPDSGTAGRGLLAYALPTALGGSAAVSGTIQDNPTTASILATLAALSTRTGARAVQRGLVSRPDAMRRAGTAIVSQRRRGGMFGAGFGSAALPYQVSAIISDY